MLLDRPGRGLAALAAAAAVGGVASATAAAPGDGEAAAVQTRTVKAEIVVETRRPDSGSENTNNCMKAAFIRWPHVENAVGWRVSYKDGGNDRPDRTYTPITRTTRPPFQDTWTWHPVTIEAPPGQHQLNLSAVSGGAFNPDDACENLDEELRDAYGPNGFMSRFIDPSAEIDVEVQEVARVVGRVLGSDGDPLKGWKVKLIGDASVSQRAEASRTKLVAETNRKGKFRFKVAGEVAAAEQNWTAKPRRARRFRPKKQRVEVAPGTKTKLRPFRKKPQ